MTMEPSADLEPANLDWRTASASGGGNCVQVAVLGADVAIGDSKSSEIVFQRYSGKEWRRFLKDVKAGVF